MDKHFAAGKLRLIIFLPSALCLLLITFNYSTLLSINNAFNSNFTIIKNKPNPSNPDSCSGRYIYIHNLPTKFNLNLLDNCRSIPTGIESKMCDFLVNSGLGPRIASSSWFSTSQFTLEVIFHNRLKKYKCLTNDSSMASAIFVPFYVGLDVSRFLWKPNVTDRDLSGSEVVRWLAGKPEWRRMWGRDHFLVAGRIGWDFRRQTDQETDWGSKFMFLPESKNMTLLSIESTVWMNDFAIPYPTYFHPSTDREVFDWRERMRVRKRKYLFTFAGAARPDKNTIRGEIIDQCNTSMGSCNFVDCRWGSNKCDNPVNVMKVFENSIFCLQPVGDSYTRRSTFDSILAGCIPVFFHSGTAYVQYVWYLPKDHTKYSVYIPMNDKDETKVNIKDTLLRFSNDKVVSMREEVLKLVPKIVYVDPRATLETLEDAFDIAIKGVLARTHIVRRAVEEGKDPGVGFSDQNHFKFRYPTDTR